MKSKGVDGNRNRRINQLVILRAAINRRQVSRSRHPILRQRSHREMGVRAYALQGVVSL